MIYLVSNQQDLFESTQYSKISVDDSLDLLKPLINVQLDTETEGLDCFTKKLLTVQLGNKDNQVVIDCLSIDILKYKEFLESNRLFLGWNLLFDAKFLYHQGIYPNHFYDGMLAEKLIWLGYPAGIIEMSLKAAADRYLHINLDKSIRGKINQTGLTEDVVVYAAHDVMYLEDIKRCQDIEVQKQKLEKAVELENAFVKCLAYIEYCGVKLDSKKWKAKMESDLIKMNIAEDKLNKFVVNWSTQNLNEIERKSFIGTNLQGDLFSGFDTEPKCKINWASSKQVIPFFELLGFNLETFDKVTKKKKKSVDAKIIKKQINVSTIAPIYLEYQEARKVVTTYGQNWLDAINPVTHRIHPNYYQLGTSTGRISSGEGLSKLNIQNIPNNAETRACFVAEEGNKFISCDYMS